MYMYIQYIMYNNIYIRIFIYHIILQYIIFYSIYYILYIKYPLQNQSKHVIIQYFDVHPRHGTCKISYNIIQLGTFHIYPFATQCFTPVSEQQIIIITIYEISVRSPHEPEGSFNKMKHQAYMIVLPILDSQQKQGSGFPSWFATLVYFTFTFHCWLMLLRYLSTHSQMWVKLGPHIAIYYIQLEIRIQKTYNIIQP